MVGERPIEVDDGLMGGVACGKREDDPDEYGAGGGVDAVEDEAGEAMGTLT